MSVVRRQTAAGLPAGVQSEWIRAGVESECGRRTAQFIIMIRGNLTEWLASERICDVDRHLHLGRHGRFLDDCKALHNGMP